MYFFLWAQRMSCTEKLLFSALNESFACVGEKLSKELHDLALCSFYRIPLFFRKVQELEAAAAWLTSDTSLVLLVWITKFTVLTLEMYV